LKGLLRAGAALIVVVVIAIAITACGSDSSSTSGGSETAGGTTPGGAEGTTSSGNASIDLGTETIEVEAGTKPKIGFFAYGLSAFELAYKSEIEKMDKEGSDVTWVESKFDAATQLKQLQTALTTGEYDAWIVEPVDAEGTCQIASELAPRQGIPVSIITQPICGRAEKPWGEEVWAPGTLNTVSDIANVTWLTNVLKAQKKVLGIGPDTKVGVLGGPEISAEAQAYEAAVKAAGIEPVEIAHGDFTVPTSQKQAQAMLSRNPDIEVILTGFEFATEGIIPALKEVGKAPGDVKVADISGSSEISVPNIKAGWLKATARTAIEQMELAFAGEQGPRALGADPPGASVTKPLLVTKENVDSFKPAY
jgi:ribose transport system substrate-binding protein